MSAGDNVIDLTGSSPASCNTPRSQIRHKYTDNKSSARDWPALSPSILLSSPLGRYCTQPLESLPIVNNEANVATGRLSNSISSLEANINNNQDDFYNLTPIRYDDDDDNNNFWTLTTHSDDDIAANDTGFNSTNTQNVFDDTTHRI
ncbi:hypothetical protein BDF22DRAFT_739023 [Syncephalis plumigaleata]|nr:hypothetical protein BDF22DRAFT_739023 [Syncephalis plumigaleata]